MVVLKISLEIEVYLLAGEEKKDFFFLECQRFGFLYKFYIHTDFFYYLNYIFSFLSIQMLC